MKHRYVWPLGLLVALGLVGTAMAQTVDNPIYQWWSAWREGASFTLQTETVLDGKVVSSQKSTQILKKLTAEKAVLEMSGEAVVGGQTIKSGPLVIDIPAKLPKIDPKLPKDGPKDKSPKTTVTTGRETLTVNAKKLDCEWMQAEVEGGTVTKAWYCDDVPGRLVKSVTTDKASKVRLTTLLIDWKGTKRQLLGRHALGEAASPRGVDSGAHGFAPGWDRSLGPTVPRAGRSLDLAVLCRNPSGRPLLNRWIERLELDSRVGGRMGHLKKSATPHRKNSPLSNDGFLDIDSSLRCVRPCSSSLVLA